eukprot:2717617-Rhodomonas_salina.1
MPGIEICYAAIRAAGGGCRRPEYQVSPAIGLRAFALQCPAVAHGRPGCTGLEDDLERAAGESHACEINCKDLSVPYTLYRDCH